MLPTRVELMISTLLVWRLTNLAIEADLRVPWRTASFYLACEQSTQARTLSSFFHNLLLSSWARRALWLVAGGWRLAADSPLISRQSRCHAVVTAVVPVAAVAYRCLSSPSAFEPHNQACHLVFRLFGIQHPPPAVPTPIGSPLLLPPVSNPP